MEIMIDKIQKYDELKKKYPDVILIFLVDNAYEVYSDDAIDVFKVTELPIEEKEGHYIIEFSVKDLDKYLPKLIKKGYRVAVCQPIIQNSLF